MKYEAKLHKIKKSEVPDITGRFTKSEIIEFSFENEKEILEILKEAWNNSERCYLKYNYNLIAFGGQRVEISCENINNKYSVTVETMGSIRSSGTEFGVTKSEALANLNDMLEIKK